jgi:general secretion pathway protein J
MTASRHSKGFTLIEILVALALMAMIATILIASLEIGGHTWQRVTRATDRIDEITLAQTILRDQLSAIYPDQRRRSGTEAGGFLSSDGSQIEFLGSAPLAQSDGIWRYHLQLEQPSGTLTLRSRRDLRYLSAGGNSDWSEEPLVRSVASVTIHFLRESGESAAQWMDQWNDPHAVPRLIRVEVTFAPSDSRRWPPLYVAPLVDTDANCIFDVVSRSCRSGA